MDISTHIGELLYGHDCVIIPGFGGFVCSYQPATIHAEKYLIYPPGKAVSFNRFLQSNDGLLVNHLAGKKGISFYEASEAVNAWVNFSNTLLARNEEITLQRIGRFFNNAEGNLQFEPDDEANYLKSSYGLRPLAAMPIARIKEKNERKTRSFQAGSRTILALRIAASILILSSIGLFAEMMRMDVHIRSLELNQASVANFVNHLFHTDQERMEPIPIPVQEVSSQTAINNSPANAQEPLAPKPKVKEEPVVPAPMAQEEPVTANTNSGSSIYYIIVGAFKDEQNAENVRQKLLLKFPAENILFEKHGLLTKVGYSAGNNFPNAHRQLIVARSEDASVWMMKK